MLLLLVILTGIKASAVTVNINGGKGTFSSDKKTFTTSASAGMAGLVITANELSKNTMYSVTDALFFTAAEKDVEETVTITAPNGYMIQGYEVFFLAVNSRASYEVTIGEETKHVVNDANLVQGFKVENLNKTSTSFTIKCSPETGRPIKELMVKKWTITLVPAQTPINVTFKVKDEDGNILDNKVFSFLNGDVVSELPKAMKYPYTNYSYGSPLVVTDGAENIFECTVRFELPFRTFTDYDKARWYMMSINSEGAKHVVASATTPWPTATAMTSDDVGLWAFKGNPYTGIEVYNKAAGPNQTLKPDSTATGSAITMKGGEPYKWTIKLGYMGFMLGNGSAFAQDYNGTFAIVNDYNVQQAASTLMLTAPSNTDYTDEVNSQILPWIESIGTGYFTLDPSNENVINLESAYTSHSSSAPWLWGDYQTLLSRLNSVKNADAFIKPTPNKFYHIRIAPSHIATQPYLVGENCEVNGTTRGKFRENASDEAGSIWYYDGTSLVNYSNGLYAVNNGSNGFCMATAPVASGGQITFERANGVERIGECNIRLFGTYNYLLGNSGLYTESDNSNYNLSSNFVVEDVEELPITLKKSGEKYYATFYSPVSIENFNITAGKIVNAYKVVSLSNDKVLLDLLDNSGAPANCGVLLVSDGDGSSTMKVTASIGLYYGSETTTGLNGVTASEPASAHSSNYFFGQSNGVLGFWKMKTNGATGGFKAYIGGTGGAKEGFGLFSDDVTGIEKLTPVGERSDAWFDLGGRKMGNGKSPKGVYIKNGKKYVPAH